MRAPTATSSRLIPVSRPFAIAPSTQAHHGEHYECDGDDAYADDAERGHDAALFGDGGLRLFFGQLADGGVEPFVEPVDPGRRGGIGHAVEEEGGAQRYQDRCEEDGQFRVDHHAGDHDVLGVERDQEQGDPGDGAADEAHDCAAVGDALGDEPEEHGDRDGGGRDIEQGDHHAEHVLGLGHAGQEERSADAERADDERHSAGPPRRTRAGRHSGAATACRCRW